MDRVFDRWDLGIGLLLVVGGAFILAWTLPDYGLTWDEAIYLDLTLVYVDYFDSLGPENPFEWSDLPKVFHNKETHPPLHRWLALGPLLLFRDVPRLLAARGATVLTASILLAAVFFWSRRRLSKPASVGASLLLLLTPRFFVHSHLFALDAAITCWWIVVLWLFYEGRHCWLAWGGACIAFIAATLTKNTAALIPMALLVWIIICRYAFRGKRALSYDTVLDWVLKLYLMVLIGGLGFFLLWPRFWVNTRYSILNYVTFHTGHPNEGVYYLGQAYSGDLNPGWHYPWVMLLATLAPVTILFLGIGFWVLIRRRLDVWSALVLVAALFPLLLFMLPMPPKYDGVRLFLAAFPGLAIVMGVGLDALLELIRRKMDRILLSSLHVRLANWAIVTVVVLVVSVSTFSMHPYQMSYYNCLVGGLPGAEKLGLSLTYWGDIVDSLYPALNQFLQPGDNLYVIGTYGNIDYPHTVTDQPGDSHHLKPGVRIRKFEPDVIASATSGAHYILVVERKDSIPDPVRQIQQKQCPIYEFSLNGVPLARLYRRVPTPSEPIGGLDALSNRRELDLSR